jgi:tRNA uridine 5-carbamoylmethylation protein Kti12
MVIEKSNGKLKIYWQAIGVIFTALILLIGLITGYTLLQAQSNATAEKVVNIEKNTTEKTAGTLKSDVVSNTGILAIHDKDISVLKANQDEMKKIQTETKQAITDLNKKMDSNQRDIMKVLLELKDDN